MTYMWALPPGAVAKYIGVIHVKKEINWILLVSGCSSPLVLNYPSHSTVTTSLLLNCFYLWTKYITVYNHYTHETYNSGTVTPMAMGLTICWQTFSPNHWIVSSLELVYGKV